MSDEQSNPEQSTNRLNVLSQLLADSTIYELGTHPEPHSGFMELITVDPHNGSSANSVKPSNVFVSLPKLLTSLATASIIYAFTGDELAILIKVLGEAMGSQINLSKPDAAVVLALHRLDAYRRKDRYVDDIHILNETQKDTEAWEIPNLDKAKVNEVLENLRKIRSVDVKEANYALCEQVRVTVR